MRIRQVKPAFWTDARLADVSDPARLFYIGLWGVADDAGWFDADVCSIGADLYPYRNRGVRERAITKWMAELVAQGRVVLHDCGHGQVPTLEEHQHLAAATKRVISAYKKHQSRDCPRKPAETRGESREEDPRGNPRKPAETRAVKVMVSEGLGQVRNGSASARDVEIFPPIGSRA